MDWSKPLEKPNHAKALKRLPLNLLDAIIGWQVFNHLGFVPGVIVLVLIALSFELAAHLVYKLHLKICQSMQGRSKKEDL